MQLEILRLTSLKHTQKRKVNKKLKKLNKEMLYNLYLSLNNTAREGNSRNTRWKRKRHKLQKVEIIRDC
jgi:hypothetical protein